MKKHIAKILVVALVLGLCSMAFSVPAHASVFSGNCGESVTWSVDTDTGKLVVSGTGPMDDQRISSTKAWDAYKNLVTSITIDEGVTHVGNSAFYQFTKLKTLSIADSVLTIGSDAFSSCYALSYLSMGNGVTDIGDFAFNACAFQTVLLGNGVEKIGDAAFGNCKKMTSIFIPRSIREVGYITFLNCTALTDVYYSGSGSDWTGLVTLDSGNENLLTAAFHYDATKNEAPLVLPFSDLAAGAWYTYDVSYVVRNGYMNGLSTTTFAPNANMTRAMVVTTLWRMNGSPASAPPSFSDVPSDTWYTDAVSWAASIGVVNGQPDGQFHPNDSITREQIATILCRYASHQSMDVTAAADLSGFADAASVAGYAVDAFRWAVANGIINGRTANTLVPRGTATRAEVSTLITRFLS